MRNEIPSHWTAGRWGDLIELVYGKPLREPKLDSGPVSVWGTNGPTGSFVTEAQGDGPTVVVGRKGAYRGVVLASGPFWVIDTAFYARPLRQIDMSWAYAALAQHDINGLDSGSAIPSTRRQDVYSLPVLIPPVAEQRAIASVIGVLADKFESNERLAQALADVVMLAPPHQGDQAPLDSIAALKNGGALTKHATGAGRPILRIKELKAGVTNNTPRTDVTVREDHEVEAGDLLFSWSGTLLTHRWSGPDSVLNQHIFRVDPEPGFPRWFVEAWIERHLSEFRAIAAEKATTMGHIQRRHLAEAQVVVPDDATMRELRAVYDPLDEYRMTLLRESRALTAIRAALLPKLVSGQVRVPLSGDPDEQVHAAAENLEPAEGAV